jgi:hypothetical protein
MFGLGKADLVAPVSFVDGVLTFVCGRQLRPGKKVKVKVHLTSGVRPAAPTVTVAILSSEPKDDETFLCTGALQLNQRRWPEFLDQLTEAGLNGACRRESRRLDAVVRVLSRELPGFRGVTADVSRSGAGLVCEGPVTEGAYLNLKLDLEMVGFSELDVQAQCVRCRTLQTGQRTPSYLVGVALTPQYPETHAAWQKFYHHLHSLESASVLAKSIAPTAGPARAAHGSAAGAPSESNSSAAAFQQAPLAGGFENGSVSAPGGLASFLPSLAPAWIQPLGIQGFDFTFRAHHDPSYLPLAEKLVQMPVLVNSESRNITVTVRLAQVQPEPAGTTCICWGTLLVDDSTVIALNHHLNR